MIKSIKFQTDGTSSNTRRKGNFLVGESTVAYGPTSSTGLYNSIIPPEGGYTLYLNKASDGPSIYVFNNNQELIRFTQSDIINENIINLSIDHINTSIQIEAYYMNNYNTTSNTDLILNIVNY